MFRWRTQLLPWRTCNFHLLAQTQAASSSALQLFAPLKSQAFLPSSFPTGKPASYTSYPANDIQPSARLDRTSITQSLETSLSERNIEKAWRFLQAFAQIEQFPERAPLNKSLVLLAYEGDKISLTRAVALISRVKAQNRLELLDADSLSLLALAFARANMCDLAGKMLRLLVRENFFPPLNVWTTILQQLGKTTAGAALAAKLFLEICIYLGNRRQKSTVIDDELLTMQPDREAFNLALKTCETAGESEKAEEIINQMRNFSLEPDNACFTSLIKVYEKGNKTNALNMMLPRLSRARVVPNHSTFGALVSAFVNLKDIDAAAQLVRDWVQKEQSRKNEKLHMLEASKGTSTSTTDSVIRKKDKTESLKESNTDSEVLLSSWGSSLGSLDSLTYGILLKGFLREGRTLDAAQFLTELQQEESSDYIDCSFAIDGLLRMGLRDEAHAILQAMAAHNAPADFPAYVSLVKAYCKIPYPDKAEEVCEDAKKVGHELSIDCREALIEMHIILQEYEIALSVFKEMKKSELLPLEPSFIRLLEVFEENSKPSLMRKLLEVARRDPPMGVELRHWNACVQCFCKARMMFDAKVTVKRMKQLGIQPNATTYAFLLNGYYTHGGKVNEMLLLWPEVLDLATPREGSEPLKLGRELLDGFLTVFVRYGYFRKALEVVAKLEEHNFFVDKTKYRKLYLEHHKHTFTSRHASQRRIDRSQERREQNKAFKSWVGLFN